MKSNTYNLIKYDADEGKVFDWVDLAAHTHEEVDEEGKTVVVQEHLYANTIFIGEYDNIENYVEVDKPQE